MDMSEKMLAAVDLGGTKIFTVIADQKLNILARQRIKTPADQSAGILIKEMVQSVLDALQSVGAEKSDLEAVGVCAPGFFDWQDRILLDSPNLPYLNNVPLEKVIGEELQVPVVAENDANAAALGEARFGAGKGSKDVVFVTVSTGIGAGLVLDGKLYRGSRGFSGEIGHMAVKWDGPLCGCGRRGCLEAVSSGTAIARSAKEAVLAGEKTILTALAEKKEISAKDIFAAAAAKDPVAEKIVEEATHYLGIGFVNTVNMLNPAVLVVGGGVAEAGEALLAPLRQIIADHAVSHIAKTVALRKAELGTEAGAIGMLCLLKDCLEGGFYIG